jgi:hypothetical protein
VNIARRTRIGALAAVTIALTCGGEAVSARPLPPALTVGIGRTLCRDWSAVRKKPEPAPAALEQWVLGYLSGYNAFAPPPKDNFTDYDSRNLLGWVDQRCALNPNGTVSQVLNDFVLQLAKSRTH